MANTRSPIAPLNIEDAFARHHRQAEAMASLLGGVTDLDILRNDTLAGTAELLLTHLDAIERNFYELLDLHKRSLGGGQ